MPADADGVEGPNILDRPLYLSATPKKGKRLVKKDARRKASFTPEQRLLILDIWKKSGLSAPDFAPLVGTTNHTLYAWRRKFEQYGPAGLDDRPRGARGGSRLPEITRRTILMIKEANPEFGCERISNMLYRGPALPASAGAVAKVLKEAGYELEEVPTRPHGQKQKRFERARPNQLWQTDLFTFTLKRQNRKVYLVGFLDDHSRYVVGYGLFASSTTSLVLEVLRAAIASYGQPEELLSDNGPQYVTWRGKSAFAKELEKRGIKHLVARPKRPQTLGKIERFWGTLWRECVETSVFVDLRDARQRIGLYIDHYNFHRVHSGIDGLVPADRFFGAAPEVRKALEKRVAANALELARQGVPRKPFYLTGQAGGRAFSVHTEGERVVLTRSGEQREEIDLVGPEDPVAVQSCEMADSVTPGASMQDPADHEQPPPAGASSLDDGLQKLVEVVDRSDDGGQEP